MKAIEARTLITVVMGVVGAILLVLVFTVELPENNQQLASVVAGMDSKYERRIEHLYTRTNSDIIDNYGCGKTIQPNN